MSAVDVFLSKDEVRQFRQLVSLVIGLLISVLEEQCTM